MSRAWLPSPPSIDATVFPSVSQQCSNSLNMEDWNQAGNFVNKPLRGWLHPDTKLSEGGITYGVRYVGCLEVNTSMKSLDFDTRSLIAKECISRLCEAAGLKTADKKRKVDKRLLKMIAEKPNMDHAGANVNLTITSSYLNLVSMENGDIIVHHEMPKISFASGGDADTLDFVSYVAKDNRYGRACFVLECGGGLAQDVITTIGQAFELRFKQFLKIVPGSRSETEMLQASAQNGNFVPSREDPEYYNDLPGKVPPDIITSSTPFDNTSVKSLNVTSQGVKEINSNIKNYPVPYATTSVQKEPSDSLIDFSSSSNVSIYRRPAPEYVNTTAVISNERNIDANKQKNAIKHDIFDMQPFATTLSTLETEESPIDSILNSPNATTLPMSNFPQIKSASKIEAEKAALLEEPWFHGAISRAESEALVTKDGDFLVRESLTTPGQYVLTGMQKTTRKHLLLVDPEGVIRTKDQVFDSVSHLIKYHQENSLPIISAESALLLRTPVCRVRSASKSVQV